jgi:hypothetical protein
LDLTPIEQTTANFFPLPMEMKMENQPQSRTGYVSPLEETTGGPAPVPRDWEVFIILPMVNEHRGLRV